MNFKTSFASGRPGHDQGNHPSLNSPLPPADVHRVFVGRTQTRQLLTLGGRDGISYDSASLFLQRERYEGKDLHNESAPFLNLKDGTLSVDESVLDKPHGQYLAIVDFFWSGKRHRLGAAGWVT